MIQLFWSDHPPPHFHAQHGDDEALINIRRLEVIDGTLSRRALALTLEWAELHQDELLEAWELCVKKQAPKKIPPLP
jgi:hypothetical protein